MSCDGAQALNPLCQTGDLLQTQSQNLVNGAFTSMSDQFGQAAMSATTWLWSQMDRATSLDLNSPDLAREMVTTSAIAGVLCLGLFLLQIITAALRREPAAIGRALKGLLISAIGSAGALACTRVLLGAVDALSEGVVTYTMGTNIQGLGQKMAFAQLSTIANPATLLLFAVIILCAVVVVWAAMMVRKMTLLISAVLAPLAFAGATAEVTRSWVRRWIEFVCAMVASKLLLVIIFSIGISVLDGAGMAGGDPTQVATQLAVGALILLMGGFAPWIAIRMFHFAGDALQAAHATAAQSSSGAKTVIAAPQKVHMAATRAQSMMSQGDSRPALSRQQNQLPAALYASPTAHNRATLPGASTSGQEEPVLAPAGSPRGELVSGSATPEAAKPPSAKPDHQPTSRTGTPPNSPPSQSPPPAMQP